jgi:hypothetical protein
MPWLKGWGRTVKPGRRFDLEKASQYQRLLLSAPGFIGDGLSGTAFEPVRQYRLPLEFIVWLLKSIYLLIPSIARFLSWCCY